MYAPLILELLNMGAGRPLTVTGTAVGWYASDDGLVPGWAGYRYKDPDDARRFWMDFSAIAEVQAGDSVAAAAVDSDLAVTSVTLSGNRIIVTVYGGTEFTEYNVEFTATLASGAVVVRNGPVRVAPGGLTLE